MRRCLLIALLPLLAAPTVQAQQDTTRLPPGVELATRYTMRGRHLLAVKPLGGAQAIDQLRTLVTGIVENDLALSDRFEMLPVPQSLASGSVDYAQWNGLNVVFVVAGELIVTAAGYDLHLEVHDIPLGQLRHTATFQLPVATAPGFRMAAHAVSDQIVQWITGQPGMAATRIAYVRQNPNHTYDLLMVDSDGENLRRIFGADRIYSPTWSPDGQRLTYAQAGSAGAWQLVERDLASGSSTVFHEAQLIMTPSYSPDGRKIAFAAQLPGGMEIHDYDVERGCCLRRLTDSNGDNVSPTYSADGSQIAFHSSRTGRQHIYVAPAEGGNARLISPLGQRVEYYAPDWSPTGNAVTFHGRSRGYFQLMLADPSRSGSQVQQLTSSGRNEDPSFAPDGRHIVYTGGAGRNEGLYVIDTVTGRIRQLVAGGGLRLADWSPTLARAAGTASGGN
jgi:TolB protein